MISILSAFTTRHSQQNNSNKITSSTSPRANVYLSLSFISKLRPQDIASSKNKLFANFAKTTQLENIAKPKTRTFVSVVIILTIIIGFLINTKEVSSLKNQRL